jgi:hypothetical protein
MGCESATYPESAGIEKEETLPTGGLGKITQLAKNPVPWGTEKMVSWVKLPIVPPNGGICLRADPRRGGSGAFVACPGVSDWGVQCIVDP